MTEATVERKGHRWFAAMYDRLSRGSEPRVAKIRHKLLADLHGDVLEIGAGTGFNFEHYPPDARVIALEPDPHMLKRARERLRPNIELGQAPAEALPYEAASFDAVVSTLVLCTVDDLERALSEILRVLRPGGRLVFIEHIRGEGLTARVQDAIRPVWRYFAAGCNPNRRTGETLRRSFEISSLEETKLAPWLPAIFGVAQPK